jgi:predicted dehydrogenase
MEKLRWGILSTGGIANTFAEGLTVVEDAELVAVGSRAQAPADAFGERWHVPHRHASYEALANDPDVDVIYVGTPHPYHCENTMLCLNAGKHVLVEKPFAMNARQAQAMIDLAREKGLFLMEAMWTRFLPSIVQVRQWIAEGAIGDVRLLRASFAFKVPVDPTHRLFAPELGGGALLDVGIYPISLASMILGTPKTIRSTAHLGETGVDEHSAYMFGYDDGKTAFLASGVHLAMPVEAEIFGTEGYIKLHRSWYNTTTLTLATPTDDKDRFNEQLLHLPTRGNGYEYEAMEVAACLRAGKTESAIMSLDETLSIMHTLDTIRAQWGLAYPNE